MKLIRIFINKIRNVLIYFNKLYVFKINLNVKITTNPDYEIKFINEIGDIDFIIKERGGDSHDRYVKWLSLGYLCIVASKNNNTIGMVWFVDADSVPLEFNQKQFLKMGKEGGLIDAYVLKNYRGKGVYSTIWYHALNAIKKRGYIAAYGYIRNDNKHSFLVHEKLGMTDVTEIIYYLKLFFFNFYYKKKFNKPKNIKVLKKNLFEI
jgi:GNAT superfamily N-acetyltransferase